MKKLSYIVLATAVVALAACNGKPDGPVDPPKNNAPVVAAPPFSSDSAYAYTEKQVAFGPRVPNTPQHKACADYLINKLKGFTDTVIVQTGTVVAPGNRNLNIYNIMGRINPNNPERILLLAHWDTRHIADNDVERTTEPILGANDGASGVGVLMEVARVVKSKDPGIGVDILFVDAEDQGISEVEDSYCLGTQYWIKNPPVPFYKPRFGILLDMVGGKDARFWKEQGSITYAGFVVDKVWSKANELGFGGNFVNNVRPAITDDHFYINTKTKIPTIDIIQYGDTSPNNSFPFYWHTHKDDMSSVDRKTLGAVGQILLGVIYNEIPPVQ